MLLEACYRLSLIPKRTKPFLMKDLESEKDGASSGFQIYLRSRRNSTRPLSTMNTNVGMHLWLEHSNLKDEPLRLCREMERVQKGSEIGSQATYLPCYTEPVYLNPL